MKSRFLLVLLLCIAGCAQDRNETARQVDGVRNTTSASVPPPPDVGDVNKFHSCKALPRRKLTEKEVCQIDRLKRRCLPSDDCLVTCLSSPDALKVGGGCEHVCFSYMHKESALPEGYGDCK